MSAQELKTARANAKRALTKEVNNIRQCIAEDELDKLSDRIANLKTLFKSFTTAHEAYHEKILEEDDIDISETYFYAEQDKYIKALEQARHAMAEQTQLSSHINDDTHVTHNGGDSDKVSTREMMGFLNMPKVELEVFSGDPLRNHEFLKSFDLNVDCMASDADMKLTRLIQYTSGRAKDAIRSCLLIGGDSGYQQARSILEERFGNAHLVSEHVTRELRRDKPVRSPEDIRHLADALENAQMILTKLDMLNEVNSQRTIMDIVSRYPSFVQNRWKRKVFKTKKAEGSYPDFDALCEFAMEISSEINYPVYGDFNVKKTERAKPKHVSANVSAAQSSDAQLTHSSNAAANAPAHNRVSRPYARPEAPCVMCGVCHRLWHCEQFRKLSPPERLNIVQTNNLCHNCLLSSHDVSQCGKKSVCSVKGCGKKHTMYIHIDEQRDNQVGVDVKVSNAYVNGDKTFMPIVQVLVNDSQTAFALLDTASSNSFCSRKLASTLNLSGQLSEYKLSTIGGSKMTKSDVVSMSISPVTNNHGDEMKMSGVFVIDSIPVKNSPINAQDYEHLTGLELAAANGPVNLGQDYSEALIPLEVRSGDRGEPFAVRTRFGWCINGTLNRTKVRGQVISHFVCLPNSNSANDDISRLWRLENDGLDHELSWSQHDKAVMELWEQECRQVDGHYELPIPWKNNAPLPNNFVVAKSRLDSTIKKLKRENLLDRYTTEIEKMIACGYAESVPSDAICTSERTWYLPHHAVLSEKKPDKVRIVFDCASKFHGKSLNDRCMQGPDLVNKLLHVLLRFRLHSYAIQADIESMYHQVRIPVSDRDALRFLWYENEKLSYYRMTSHLFGGIWCASSSTYALRRTIRDNPDSDTLIKDTVDNAFYVDDCLKSVTTEDAAVKIVRETPELLHKGGFNLTKFVVNKSDILNEISVKSRAKEVQDFCPETQGKVLGIKWKIMPDVFFFDVNLCSDVSVTRRKMLSIAASIFDPLGLLNPVILLGKLLLQDATRMKLNWDDEVPEVIKNEWVQWLKSLQRVKQIEIPRCIKPAMFDQESVIELHHFCDGSERAYGACSFIRCINSKGHVHSQLIMSKCKVAPIKQQSIPRLELQGAVLAAKMDALLLHELDITIDGNYFWTDSEIVLKYIKNETKRFHVFVGNRVSQIRQFSDPSQWHHVSTDINSADKLTRAGNELDESWYAGPQFLKQYKSEWPVTKVVTSQLPENDPEVKRDACVNVNKVDENYLYHRIMSHYSSWYRMQRALAWWLRLRNMLCKTTVPRGNLTTAEIQKAKFCLIGHIQKHYYPDEMACLNAGRSVKKSSDIVSFQPYLDDDGLIRVGGRLTALHDLKMHPCLIPGKSPLAAAVVRDVHSKAHLGVEWTLSLIREEFWVTKARPLVKRIIKSCVICKRLYARPCTQKMADLPRERIEPFKPAFTNVGLDIFGPITVKNYRSDLKRYGCIFTCMVTRAIHLEKLNSLETDSFLNGFRRFIARRGMPETIFCDNGTSFVGGENELKRAMQELQSDKVQHFTAKNGIDWRFIPPCAPHMGGAWERLIGTIKRVMKGLLVTRLTDEILETVFCEVESIVNGRPLTKLSENPNDPSPLTPNHLLLMRKGACHCPGKFSGHDVYKRRWRHVQHLADQFWRKWLKLYLPELQRRVKWHDTKVNLSAGDLVMISDENTPRNLWPLAVVKEVNQGRDGLVRSVKVQTRSTTLVRPITKVILLESASENL